jgi:hypothetical protein
MRGVSSIGRVRGFGCKSGLPSPKGYDMAIHGPAFSLPEVAGSSPVRLTGEVESSKI